MTHFLFLTNFLKIFIIFNNFILKEKNMVGVLKLKMKGLKYRFKIFWQDITKILLLQIVIFLFCFLFERGIGFPKMKILWQGYLNLNLVLAGFLFLLFLLISFLSFKELSPKEVAKNKFKNTGIYKYVRHPFYGAIVFLLNPAIAFFFESFGLLIACIFSYFLWKTFAKEEEERLLKKFEKEYKEYQIKTSRLFLPKAFELSWIKKRIIFYVLVGFSSFVIVMVVFNLYIDFQAKRASFTEKIFTEEMSGLLRSIPSPTITISPSPQNTATSQNQNQNSFIQIIDKNAYLNGVLLIPKINVKAPIVFVSNLKYLDYYHKYGVVHYPDTSLPGKGGAILISGHSSGPPNVRGNYDYVFSKLNSLLPGDKIIIFFEGKNYTYNVFKKEIVWPAQVRLREYKDKETLTLISCWPVGTNARRIVVEAERVE